jgi:hypothetical protein
MKMILGSLYQMPEAQCRCGEYDCGVRERSFNGAVVQYGRWSIGFGISG